MSNEEKKMHIHSENVAIPEIHFDEMKEDDNKIDKEIDFDAAIPEFHFKSKETNGDN